VLDINNHPGNSVIGDRSFGSNKKLVSQLGVATMEGIQTQHVISVVKHFPGYGAATTDAHTGLPVVNYNVDRLMNAEWVPYKKAIKQKASAVMVTHILLPKLDSEYPASLSKKAITGELRNKLHFKGVVITDDLTMEAIKRRVNVSNAAVQAVKAGADIVMVAFDNREETSTFHALKYAVKHGKISEKQIDESVTRIIQLKQQYKLSNEHVKYVNIQRLNKKIKTVLNEKF
jgi:beta-N-acetylhexosaminidase